MQFVHNLLAQNALNKIDSILDWNQAQFVSSACEEQFAHARQFLVTRPANPAQPRWRLWELGFLQSRYAVPT